LALSGATQAQLREGEHFLIREQNAVPFDLNAAWKEDMVPDYLISRTDAKGSAADNNAVAFVSKSVSQQ